MIDLFASDRIREIGPKIEQFIRKEVIPLESEMMGTPFFDLEKNTLNSLRQRIKELGLWAPHLPEEEGGLGLNLMEFALISELMALTPYGHFLFNCQAPDIGNMELMGKYASESLKSKYLEPLHSGRIRSCFSMTEPEFPGSNPVLMATTAVKEGDDYIINGHKWFTTAADGAEFAVVMAITDSENPNPYQRASMIVVPSNTPGFDLVRNIPIMGETGEGYASHAEIRYEDCRVPADHLIHKEGTGFALAQERLGPGRIHHCMRWIGISERALEMMVERAANRELKAGKKLGHQQTIQNWIAESRASIDASRYMVLHTAYKMEKEGNQAARMEISTIKFYVAKVLMEVLDRAIQAHGALGITDDLVLSWWYRHERGSRIYDGPDEVHKSVVARKLLKDKGLGYLMIDSAKKIRDGEELPLDILEEYLKNKIDLKGKLEVLQFPSGYSNLTYMLKSGDREWVLRRPPYGANIKSAHDMGREFKVLSLLEPVFSKIPAPVHFCEDESVIGAPFYLMKRVKGIILRSQPPVDFRKETWNELSRSLVDQLVELHQLDIHDTRLIELGKPEGYVKRQVEGWTKRYFNAKTDEIHSMEFIAEYMSTDMPENSRTSMIHNDYKYDNLVLSKEDPAQILAILDWEMATVGDPLMDLATSLAYWAEEKDHPALRPFNLTWVPGNLTRNQVLERYEELTGSQAANPVYYYAYACFKLGVICQQIYARYKAGHTKDPRFAGLIEVVKACGENGKRAIELKRIGSLY